MDDFYENETIVVEEKPASIVNDIPIYSRTASRRTVAKYLKRRNTISKLMAKEQNTVQSGVEESQSFDVIGYPKFDIQMPFCSPRFSPDLPPLMLPSNLPDYVNSFSIKTPFYTEDNQENNSSINDMLRCVLEGNMGFVDSIEKNSDFPPPWLTSNMPFNFCDSHITSSSLSASIDKQEREIAYNLLVRRIIDETLDRNIIFSHQPKELLNLINLILVRQFTEYEESKHRSKVRSYLKACRRNSKKNNGKILMKNTAAYLSSGPGNRLMHQIYNNEKETIDVIKKESERLRIAENNKHSRSHSELIISSATQESSTQQKHIISNCLPSILPASISSIHTTVKPVSQVFSSTSTLNVTQLPLLMPFNSTVHMESIKKTSNNSEYSKSDEIIKSISEIAKTLVGKDSGVNMRDIVVQLKATANFLDKVASNLEQSMNNSID